MSKIKVILADDELTSRNTIKNYLMNNEDYEIVADFSDGRSVLQWLRENDADILLCDMQMPEMNGVELMRLVHIINEFMPVIAVSGFDNFDYVRGSLINGAANYLLKHELTREKLLNVLDQVREKYRIVPKEKAVCRRTGYCIYDRKKFTAQNIRQLVKAGEIAFECGNVVPLAISPDYHFGENIVISECKQGIVSAITDILAQILGQDIPYLVYITQEHHLVILLSFYHVRSNMYMINAMKNIAGRLQRQVVRMLDITCTMFIGSIHQELEKAISEGMQMERCLEDKLYLGGNRTLPFAVNEKLNLIKEELPLEFWKQLQYEIDNDVADELETIRTIFEFMEEKRYSRQKVTEITKRIAGMLLSDRGDEKQKIETRIEEYEIFEEFRGEILGLCHNRKARKTEGRKEYSALVMHVLDYVEKNYSSEISLEDCAERFNCSYTYLSRAFKQETGMRFVEYVNQCRLKKAKSLLIRNAFSMKEIVEKAGFRNYNYFFKVFKESEGITPSEFSAKN